ncbi:transaldolase family protein [Thiomonas sp. FB-6]|uniref:transaldolase family protein n=1 Tax=Thiomonas sp. FB-6 TaxID=1158291 RepID=UPI0003748935|nr:transaldolase family protein [Thiomonas sp. FB-6]
MSSLHDLTRHTRVVADTAEYLRLPELGAAEATTNPSLVLRAVRLPEYAPLLRDPELRAARDPEQAMDRLLVRFGREILERVPGRVSTEIDARLSHDTDASVQRARGVIALYEAAGVPRQRVLIKLATTWEGIEAARRLRDDGISCNMTLLFSFMQARACAAAGVQLVSPFVGRISDWARQQAGAAWDPQAHEGEADPGVRALLRIWRFYKARGVATEVMGASFRQTSQIAALCGCDLLTISPALLGELAASAQPLPRRLDPAQAGPAEEQVTLAVGRAEFASALAADEMWRAKLDEGIASFSADTHALLELLRG